MLKTKRLIQVNMFLAYKNHDLIKLEEQIKYLKESIFEYICFYKKKDDLYYKNIIKSLELLLENKLFKIPTKNILNNFAILSDFWDYDLKKLKENQTNYYNDPIAFEKIYILGKILLKKTNY